MPSCNNSFASKRGLLTGSLIGLVLLALSTQFAIHDTSAYLAGSPCDASLGGWRKYACAQTDYYWDPYSYGWFASARYYNGSTGNAGQGVGYNRWWLNHHNIWAWWNGWGWVKVTETGQQGAYSNGTFWPSSVNLGSQATAGQYVYAYYCYRHQADSYYKLENGVYVYVPPVSDFFQIRHELHTLMEYAASGCSWS